MKLKYLKEDLRFLKALWSPFKPFRLKFYFGKTKIGTPYFLPRKWVKATPARAHKATLEQIDKDQKWNELNPKYARKIKSYEELYKEYMKYSYPIPRKIGFDFVRLGWKTKWREDDYRFEWGPMLSFVFFGYQIAIMVKAPEQDHYWEAWLYYEYSTDDRLPKWMRIRQCREKFPMTYTRYSNERTETTDYYTKILKSKYLK
jgi:hypothetical protein